MLTAVLALGLAGLAVLYLGTGFGGGSSHGRPYGAESRRPAGQEPTTGGATPPQTPSVTATPTLGPSSPPVAQQFVRLPPVCSTPPETTSLRLVPSPRITTKSGNSTVTTCTVVSTGGSRPSLHVEAYLFPPRDGGDPAADAAGLVSSDWTQAHKDDGQTTTVVLERYPDLGGDAFRWYKVDKGEPVVVGEVEVRSRNAVVRVAYSRDAPAKADEQATRTRLLDEAVSVARQAVQAFA